MKMNSYKEAMRATGYSQTMLAEVLGITQGAVQQRLNGNPRINSVLEIADAIGYKVMLVPKAKKVDGAFEIEAN